LAERANDSVRLTRRPLVLFHHGAFKSDAATDSGSFIVRNRSPCDIVVECLRVNEPSGARLTFQSGRAVKGEVPTVKRRVRTLGWRLPAYGSGEFPFKSDWFEVDLTKQPEAAFVELEIILALSRPMMFSRRLSKRHRIRRIGKKSP
jgi:hypothetical protein